MGVVVTKEIVDCEVMRQGTDSSARMAAEAINDDGVSGNAVLLPSGDGAP